MSWVLLNLGVLLDQLLGEPKRYHPLVGFGQCATYLENRLNSQVDSRASLLMGAVAVMLLILPFTIISYVIDAWFEGYLAWLFSALLIYWAVGFKSLILHARNVANALAINDLEKARYATSLMVSRDTDSMNETQITSAVIESTLENGCDSTFAVVFWYLVGGPPMVVFYRLSNTLDAMWGYRNQRFEAFGKCAAKLDDFLNYIPARLTALSYALCGDTKAAINSWQTHAKQLSSPNGGPAMTSGAGSLNLKLGGPASYHGSILDKPLYGGAKKPVAGDILRANRLVTRALLLWCFTIMLCSLVSVSLGFTR